MSAVFLAQNSLPDLTTGNIFQTEEASNQNQAPGPDGIPQRVLKDCKLTETLCDILNASF